MTGAYLRTKGLCLETPTGRTLIRDLSLSLARDRVALIGRNGVGKSTLLRVLAGELRPERGLVDLRVEPAFVRQELDFDEVARAARWLDERWSDRAVARDAALLELGPPGDFAALRTSPGQARKLLLLAAKHSGSELLLLDEPSEDLDDVGVTWLCEWLRRWDRGAIVVTHHRGLLRCFEDFFAIAESGCRHLHQSFAQLQATLAREQAASQQQYVEHLNVLAAREHEHERIRRRRARKKNVGRLHELRRCTSKMRLNTKRGYAQVSQAKAAKIREQRIAATRSWAKATRRALSVKLPLNLRSPSLPDAHAPLVELAGVGVVVGGRSLFTGLDLEIGRQRVAIVGPNGSGKTTLLRVMLGQRAPTHGSARCRIEHIGVIAQAAEDWSTDESLLERLAQIADAPLAQLAERIVAHEFPLALAQRPLRSLSPGERVRAALICLFQAAPRVELLVLDEPSHALDFVGVAALERSLRAWPGGLVVVSHDRELLDGIGFDRWIELGATEARSASSSPNLPRH